MAIWINTGTISISAGGTTITGSGTSFQTGGTQKGDMFQAPDGREYEITNITSDTQMSIYKAYQGTNVTGSTNWDIIPTQGYVKALVDEVREYVETNNTIVEEIDGSGLSVAHGGTGATTATGARTNLDALGKTETAADSAKLGGVAAGAYAQLAAVQTLTNKTVPNLKFSNTASSDVNTLDWYEEGSFTPVVIGTTTAGVGTYTYQDGKYTRIGNRVFFNLRFNVTAHTGTGQMRITGLPYTPTSEYEGVYIGYANNITFTGTQLGGYVDSASLNITIYGISSNATVASIPIDTSFALIISGSYRV
ncbi:MAG: hypothetical protein AB7F25_07110 [Deferribacterales bacterium]